MKLLILFVIFFSSFQNAQSNPLPILLIGEIEGKNLVPANFSKEMQKTLVRVASNQSDYQLMIGGGLAPDPKLNVYIIKSNLSKIDNFFSLKTELHDNKRNKTIRTFTVDKVPAEDLIRMYEALLTALFTKPVKSQVLPPKKERNKQDKEVQDEIQTNPPNASAINFKKIIESLKMGTNQAVEIALNESGNNEQQENEETKKTPSKKMVPSTNTQSTITLTSKLAPQEPSHLNRGLPGNMLLSLGWENRDNRNKNILTTTSNAKSMVLNFSLYKPLNSTNSYLSVGSDNSLYRIIDFPYEVSIPYQASLFSQIHLFNDQIRSSLGVKRDQGFYVNLIGPGEGLKAFDIITDWLQWQLAGLFYRSEIKLTISYLANSDGNNEFVNTNNMDGNYYQFMFAPPMIIKGWNSFVMFDKMSLSSKGAVPFESTETRFQLGVSTSF